MDENQSPNEDGQESIPTEPSEPNVYEPQPRVQPSMPEPPAPKKSRMPLLIVALLILLLVGGGAAAYFMTQEDEPAPVETSQVSEETKEPAEEVAADVIYKSKLYPDLSFKVPDGWEVTEPEAYDENDFGDGSADGTITVSDGDVTVKFDLVTVFATGFEGYSCYNRDGVTAVGNVYRFVTTENVVAYEAGITEANDEWAEVIADEGEFTTFEDPEPNYCVSFPYIGTYSSTLNQADFPDQPYGFTEKEKVIVWLSAVIEDSLSEEQQSDADAIIKSLSQPDLGV